MSGEERRVLSAWRRLVSADRGQRPDDDGSFYPTVPHSPLGTFVSYLTQGNNKGP